MEVNKGRYVAVIAPTHWFYAIAIVYYSYRLCIFSAENAQILQNLSWMVQMRTYKIMA